MSEIPYYVRSKVVTTLDSTDSLYLDDASSDVPKKITLENFMLGLESPYVSSNTILNGGENNIDEDVPMLMGGLNGVSKNSIVING
jgi:hypothetical protein